MSKFNKKHIIATNQKIYHPVINMPNMLTFDESGHADIVTASAGNATEYRYYVRDYLGSTRAVLAEDGYLYYGPNSKIEDFDNSTYLPAIEITP